LPVGIVLAVTATLAVQGNDFVLNDRGFPVMVEKAQAVTAQQKQIEKHRKENRTNLQKILTSKQVAIEGGDRDQQSGSFRVERKLPQAATKNAGQTVNLSSAAAGVENRKMDRYGDLLPSGALVRMGTSRFRPGEMIYDAAFSPDGKILATSGRNVFFWDSTTGKLLREDMYDERGASVPIQNRVRFVCGWQTISIGPPLRRVSL